MSKDIIDGEGKQTVESHKKKKKQAETAASLLAGIAAAAAFLLLFFAFQWNFFLCAGLSVALFIALALLIRPQKKIGQMEVSAVSGGEELYQKLEEAREDLDNIGRLMEQVEDETVRAQSRHLHETAGSILAYLEKHPNKIKLRVVLLTIIRTRPLPCWQNMWSWRTAALILLTPPASKRRRGRRLPH